MRHAVLTATRPAPPCPPPADLYGRLAQAISQDYSSEVAAAISAAFRRRPLLWLPDKPLLEGAMARYKEEAPGRFHAAADCVFFDQSRTMEALADPRVPVRVLGARAQGHA